MKNLKVGKKFTVVFSSLIGLFIVIAVVMIFGMFNTGKKYSEFYENSHEAITRALDIRVNLQAAAKSLSLATIETNDQNVKKYVDEAVEDISGIKEQMEWFFNSYKGDKAILTQFENQMNATMDLRNQLVQLALENTAAANAKAQDLLLTEYNPKLEAARTTLNGFTEAVKKAGEQDYRQSMQLQTILLVTALLLSTCATVIAVFMALSLTKAIVFPVKELQGAMEEIAAGNLNASITYQSEDELGQLAEGTRSMMSFLQQVIGDEDYLLTEMGNGNFNVSTRIAEKYVGNYRSLLDSLNKLRNSLSSTLSQINQSADQVAMGADQVSSGAQSLSQGATEQASSVEELAATINEISNNINQNAENAKLASQKAEGVKGQSEESRRRMQEMLAAMGDISDSSSQIGKIIKTIEDIAFQTNILALNAAVEAARAGAAGKGFAVVADEVRNLAGKSAEASKNTSALIEGSLRAVERGTKIANETAHALNEVVEGVQGAAETVDLISRASVAQASSVAQVTQGIDQISSVVQTNSATAEESAAASEELSGQAQILKGLVSQFRLMDESPSISSMPVQTASVRSQSVRRCEEDSFGILGGDDKY